MREKKIKLSLIIGLLVVFLIIWGFIFGIKVQEILYNPLITPEEWCQAQPCVNIVIFGEIITLVKPTSSIFVYSLGFITLYLGIFSFLSAKTHKSKLWWGIALILWGLGAIFAGTSYQLFSYELKCSSNPYCIWTTWFEIVYLILSVGSIDAMFVAQTYSCIPPKKFKLSLTYAYGHFICYLVIILIGAYIPIRFLISFEFLIIILIPNILYFLILNGKRYAQNHYQLDRNLIYIWIFLMSIIASYFIYYTSGITEILWTIGIWFSENDVLHIGLIMWMIYIQYTVRNYVKDFQ